MPVIPVTFTDGTSITAADMGLNLDTIGKWANGGITGSDLSNTTWVERKHLVRPSWDGISTTWHFMSCLVSGQAFSPATSSYSTSRYSYTNYQTQGASSLSTCIPSTGFSFRLPRTAIVIYQFSGNVITNYDSTRPSGNTQIRVIIDRLGIAPIIPSAPILYATADTSSGVSGLTFMPRNPLECSVVQTMSAGDHTVELVADSSATKTMLVAWTISLECHWL